MLNNRLPCRTARLSSRGGFTLVELLVVIGIIAILAGVALGPITNGIKKAKQSAGVQSAHAIGLAMLSFANDNSSTYPDTALPVGNTGSGAAASARALISGGYVTDPTIFFISGGASTKYTGALASAATTIAQTEVSWDFMGAGGNGMTQSYPDAGPLMWNSIVGGTQVNVGGMATQGTAIVGTPATSNAYGTDGMVVYYKSGSSKFIVGSGTHVATVLKTTDNPGGAPGTPTALVGGG